MANQLFNSHTNEEHTQALANELPNGRVFSSKNMDDSNFRQYLRIFAPEMSRYESTMLELSREHDINESDVYIENWESAVGIPDDCFPGTGSLEERRAHVIVKLACMNVSTEEEMIALAAKLGTNITIEPLTTQFLPPYDIPYQPADAKARFKWIIRGDDLAGSFPPYNIPYSLEVGNNLVVCALQKVKPAFIQLIFLNPGDTIPESGAFSSGYDSGYG